MTKTRRHHWVFKLWIKIRGLLALLIILAGVSVGLMSLLLPFEFLYKDRLVGFLENQWQMEVSVAEINGSWEGYGPSFELSGLSLKGEQSLQLKSAQIQLNIYQWLIPGGERGIDLSINEAELAMIQSGARVEIKSEGNQQQLSQTLDRLLSAGSLRVQALKLKLLNNQDEQITNDLTADFLLQQGDYQRGLQLLISEADNQELDIRAVTDRSMQIMESAQWYVRFDDVSVAFLQPFLTVQNLPEARVSGDLWVTTEQGVIVNARGDWQWQQLNPDLSFRVQMDYQGDQQTGDNRWQLSKIKLGGETLPSFNLTGHWQGQEVTYLSQNIPIPWISHILTNSLLPDLTESQRKDLIVESRGQINQILFRYNHHEKQLLSLSAEFSDLATRYSDMSLSGLSGEWSFGNNQSRIRLDSEGGELIIPDLYRGELHWQRLLVQANWQHGISKQLTINQFWCKCEDFKLDAKAGFKFDDKSYFQFTGHLSAIDMAEMKNYWPHNVWKPKTVNWLDQALLSGTITSAKLTASGEMRHHTFKEGTAKMTALANINDASVRFNPNWPVVEGLNAQAEITSRSVDIEIFNALTKRVRIEPSKVSIADFTDVEVYADIHAHGEDNEFIDYLNDSSLSSDVMLQADLSLTGYQSLDLVVSIPIKEGVKKPLNPQGKIRLSRGGLKWKDLSLSDINGVVLLDGFSLKPQDIKAQLAGRDINVEGFINTRDQGTEQMNLQLTGQFGLADWFSIDLTPTPLIGLSTWQIALRKKNEQVSLIASTDFVGVEIDLPAPLEKSADTAKQLVIMCDIPCNQGTVNINYADNLRAEILVNNEQFTVKEVVFGQTNNTSNAAIRGHIQRLNLDNWLALAKNWVSNKTDASLQSMLSSDILVDELIFMSRTLSNVQLSLRDQSDGLLIEVNGDAVKGRILVAHDLTRRGITAEFDYLNWQQADQDILPNSDSDRAMPDIHLWAKQFSFADIPLGSLRMELRNVADGIKVEQLSMKSELIELNANGEWLRTSEGLGTSRFNIIIISERIADFLQQMDFNAPISNAQMLIEMDVYWPGLPAAFDVAALSGDLRIAIGQGEVLDQQPGFGRVLGLFNLTNLPRRLLLDFRDVLSDGLHFEEMSGEFVLTDGEAYTEDFLIRASAAKIHMQGVVDFVDKTYDQYISIRPQIGKTFPTLGAIAGGPVGAAAGFLVQGLLGNQLKSANEIKYHVTGPWSEPKIELLEQADE